MKKIITDNHLGLFTNCLIMFCTMSGFFPQAFFYIIFFPRHLLRGKNPLVLVLYKAFEHEKYTSSHFENINAVYLVELISVSFPKFVIILTLRQG